MWERDCIRLRGMEFYAYHGVLPEERKLGQRFGIDLDLYLDLRKAGTSDRLEDTIDYGAVYQVVRECVAGEDNSCQLLERLAERIAQEVLRRFSCQVIRVEVHKQQAPIPGVLREASVEIWREAGEKP